LQEYFILALSYKLLLIKIYSLEKKISHYLIIFLKEK